MKLIKARKLKDQNVIVPGSKSISHRMLICACLCDGVSEIHNLLESEDIGFTMKTLELMGACIEKKENSCFRVSGFAGNPKEVKEDIYLGNSGTSMRLLAGVAALGSGTYTLTGNERMCERPMMELIDALNSLGIKAWSDTPAGTPPVHIKPAKIKGGQVNLDCSRTSQYLSSLMMMGPVLKNGLEIQLDSFPVSSPYIDLTMDIMKRFNVRVFKKDQLTFHVPGNQAYIAGNFYVEPDLSNAGYFWAAGAVSGSMIRVENINSDSLQGDLEQINILEKMGCRIEMKNNSIGVCGPDRLSCIEADMSGTPDAVPAIAVAAAFAEGKTRIFNIGHLREKECDRIEAVCSQLEKIGIRTTQGQDWIEIHGGKPAGPAEIETFNDHRIAMAFSIAGLKVPGIIIQNETCVEKSFPEYWKVFDGLE